MPQKTKRTPMMEQYMKVKEQYPDAFLSVSYTHLTLPTTSRV